MPPPFWGSRLLRKMLGIASREESKMEATRSTRNRIPARPRINATEGGDRESWHRRAFIRYADIVALVGPEPEDLPCERWGYVSSCKRRPCEPCEERGDWEEGILDLVRDATGWGLWGSGYGVEGCPGQLFSGEPHIYRHKRHRGVVVVSWGGGRDV